jgi:hypothetical protein
MEKLDAILTAVTGACEGAGDDLTVNLDTLESLLIEGGIGVKVLNRPALLSELSYVRDEQRVQRTRARNAQDAEAQAEREEVVRRLAHREEEIVQTLWPAGKAAL